MNSYEEQYIAYRDNLIRNSRFIEETKEIYGGATRVAHDNISRNGILWKIGILSGVCGFCISSFSSPRLKIVSFVIACICLILCSRISSSYAKHVGENTFWVFRIPNHIKETVAEDQQREQRALLERMNGRLFNIRYYAQKIKERQRINPDAVNDEELKALLYWIDSLDDFTEQCDTVSNYDRFSKDLVRDYVLDCEIHSAIKR